MDINFFGQKFNHQNNLKLTDDFLSEHPELNKKIGDLNWAYNEIGGVIPQYIGKYGSGHYFPYMESQYELECSFQLVRLSFYKHAFISLRNAFELGLLSIYWDRNDDSEVLIKNWYKSKEDTPFKKQIIKGLSSIDNVQEFCKYYDLIERIVKIYGDLSDFNHTKGYSFSANKLNQSNFTRFNESALKEWIKYFEKVVQLLLTIHILKYPVAIQYTPMIQKFGINAPFGTFLDVEQSENIKLVLDQKELVILQQISDNDENAKTLAAWVNSHSDISDEDFKKQLDDFDESIKQMHSNNTDK
jgi:hypothetical protein